MAAIAEQEMQVPPRCIVIGAKGRSGRGAVDALTQAGCSVTEWDKEETEQLDRAALFDHDLLVNCVLMTGPGLLLLNRSNLDKPGTAIATISDVSCDPLSDYNPLPVYDAPTNWDRPFIEIGHNGVGRTVELTAIDNLPSLVPLALADPSLETNPKQCDAREIEGVLRRTLAGDLTG